MLGCKYKPNALYSEETLRDCKIEYIYIKKLKYLLLARIKLFPLDYFNAYNLLYTKLYA